MVSGDLVEGVYRLACGEKRGHYHIEDGHEKGTELTVELDDGQTMLTPDQLQRKMKIQGDMMRKVHKVDDKVKSLDETLKALIDRAAREPPEDPESNGEGEESEAQSKGSRSDEDNDNDIFGDEASAFLGGGVVFARAGAKAGAKAAAKAGAKAGAGSKAAARPAAMSAAPVGLSSGVGAKRGSSSPLPKKRGRPKRDVVDLTDKASEVREGLDGELQVVQKSLDLFLRFTETHDTTRPDELKVFKGCMQQRIRDLASVQKALTKTFNALRKAPEAYGLKDLISQAEVYDKLMERGSTLCRLMLKDGVTLDCLDAELQFLQEHGHEISFPYFVKQFKSGISHACQFNNFSLMVELCTFEYDGPLMRLKTKMSREDLDELVMSQIEFFAGENMKGVTAADLAKGGPTKVRLVSMISALLAQSRLIPAAEWRQDWAIVLHMLTPDNFSIGQVEHALNNVRNAETGHTLELNSRPVLHQLMSLPLGPKIVDAADADLQTRGFETKAEDKLDVLCESYQKACEVPFCMVDDDIEKFKEAWVAVSAAINVCRGLKKKTEGQARQFDSMVAEIDQHLVDTFDGFVGNVLAKALELASQKNLQGALKVLARIPSSSEGCFGKCSCLEKATIYMDTEIKESASRFQLLIKLSCMIEADFSVMELVKISSVLDDPNLLTQSTFSDSVLAWLTDA
jgi:hypothetical protein